MQLLFTARKKESEREIAALYKAVIRHVYKDDLYNAMIAARDLTMVHYYNDW